MPVRIHFILPGGGVKGSFQGGFLSELLESYSDQFTIERVDGTSVGALNGYAFSLGASQQLRATWYQIGGLTDVFSPSIDWPILSTVAQGYNLVHQYGIYDSSNLAKFISQITSDQESADHPLATVSEHDPTDIKEYETNRGPCPRSSSKDTAKPTTSFWDYLPNLTLGFSHHSEADPSNELEQLESDSDSDRDSQQVEMTKIDLPSETEAPPSTAVARPAKERCYHHLDRYYCVVVSLREGISRYINGSNPMIQKYVHASACPWIISPPHHLEGDMVTDGGLLEIYPTQMVGKTDADLTVLVGYDSTKNIKTGDTGSNFLAYFNRLIDISRCYLPNITEVRSLFESLGDRGVVIDNPMTVHYLDFDPTHIQAGFEEGQKAAHRFARQYLLSS